MSGLPGSWRDCRDFAGHIVISDRISPVGVVPVLVLLMTGEAVYYIGSIFTDIVNYSCLPGYFLNMTYYAMFHVFAGRPGMYLLKMQKEYSFHILREI